MSSGDRVKKIVGAIYSGAADRLYEPIVVQRAFPLFGGDLNDLVLAQGRRAVTAAEGEPILDMPVGTAYFTLSMAKKHEGLVVGADIAAGMVRKAREAAAQSGVDNVAAVQADAHRLPFDSGTFAAVMCTNGLQVMPGLTKILRELARVLQPEGRLYVSTVTVPLGAVLPRDAAERLPTPLKSEREIVGAVADEGLAITSVHKHRLALLIEATKSQRSSRRSR